MNESPYNKLPEYIQLQYQIVYSEWLFENITMFKNIFEKWGVLRKTKKMGLFSTYECIIKPIYNSSGFNKDLELIEVVKYENNEWNKDKNIHAFFDTKGNKIRQFEKGESIKTDKFENVFVCREDKIGLLDKNFHQIIAPKYEQLNAINDSFFKAFQNGKWGIINKEDTTILSFEFTDILNRIEKNKVIVIAENNQYFSFNLSNRSLTKLPFNKILNASSNTYGAPSTESFNLFKSIIFKDELMDFDDYSLEMLRFKGKWGIINGLGEVVIPNEYCFVDFLKNPKYFKVGIGTMEIEDFEDKEQNFRTSIKNVKWGIVDINHKVIVPIEYEWIDEVESTIWVVYKGGTVFYNDDYQEDYWTIENGKLGVYNLSKLITPIEYDTIKKSWYRIRTYIFVQKGTQYFDENEEFDVFTLDGKKIEHDKPNPKDYYNHQ